MIDDESLREQVDALKDIVAKQSEQIDELKSELAEEREARRKAEERLDDLETTVEGKSVLAEKTRERVDIVFEMIGELQSRELEKGAHLRWEHVEPIQEKELLGVAGGQLERISKEHGQYVRLPEESDPLDRGGSVRLHHGDLLPIQQLAQLEESTLRSAVDARPDRLAAQVWQARSEPKSDLWNRGCNGVEEYLDAGELATWIRIQEEDVSSEYATKLAKRTIDALLDLSKHRLYDEYRSRRADGLQYKERRVVLPADSEIPGEVSREKAETPATAGVAGD